MLTIGDIVTIDQQAEFRNDVQLDAFDNPRQNLGLLRSYLFSSATPYGRTAGLRSVSSISLLNDVIERYLDSRLENRLAVIANYGHGKSHLALAMANYFSRSFEAEETQIVLDKLEKAVNDPARAARFHDFKHHRGEFLVVRLRGDIPRTLREQFLFGLERALKEHAASEDVEMPFWYRLVENALAHLSGRERERADQFLETHHLDVPQLLDQVRKRKDVYPLCEQLFTHLHDGMPPNLGGAVSLRDAVDWAAQRFCTNGPLGGMLILFDEFSSYVQRFAHRATGDLQDLLNGVDNQRGKVVFLAFGQHDPLTVADSTPMQGTVRDSLKRELTRIRQQEKFVLYSLMESVIDAYLRQDKDAWKSLKQDVKLDTRLFAASTAAMDHFTERYQGQLRWGAEQFQQTVTEGCFPLHPMTTAFLCNVKLQAASEMSTPRTVLGFVMDELHERCDQPVLTNGRLNWVLPVELVDYFESRLAGEDQFRAYQNAHNALDRSAPEAQRVLLKALLLQQVAVIKARGDDQITLLAYLADMPREQVRTHLSALANARVIRYDQLGKDYLFRSVDVISANELERIIEKQLEGLPFDEAALSQFKKHLNTLAPQTGFGTVPIDLAWGDKTDWAAKELIITREFCDAQSLGALLRPWRFSAQEFDEDARGALIWLLARDEDDVAWYRENINAVIDAAFLGDAPLPIVCVIAPEPLPEFIDAFQRWRALNSLRDEDRRKIGNETLTDEYESVSESMLESLVRLRGHETRALDLGRAVSGYAVPLAYRARINGFASPSIRNVFSECYSLAYRHSPPEFLTQYRANAPKLRLATRTTAKQLMRGSAASLRQGTGGDAVARDLCNKILYAKWQLLSPELRVQEPGERRIRAAWDYLDQIFAPGQPEAMVRDVVNTLLTAPYGYDFNTLTLLFAAWYGWHSHDITVSAQGRIVRSDSVETWLEPGPKDFITKMAIELKVALARAEPGTATRRLQELIQRWKTQSFTLDEAQALRAQLQDYAGNDTYDEASRDAARRTVREVETALEAADEYETEASKLSQTIIAERDLEKLIRAQGQIKALPYLTKVTTDAPQPAALRTQLTERLNYLVENFCREYTNLQSRTQLGLHQNNLTKLQALVQRADLPELRRKIDEARVELERRAKELAMQEQEAALADRIRDIAVQLPLKQLYAHRGQLEAMQGLAQRIQQVRDAKLAEITGRIAALESDADQLLALLSDVNSGTALNAWRDKALRLRDQVDGTPYATRLDQAMTQATQLQALFAGLASIQNAQWNTPDDLRRAERELHKLEERHGAVLEASQRAAVAAVQQLLADRAVQRRQEAINCLNELERKYASGTAPQQLRSTLVNPPAFLPPPDLERWQKLQARVEEAFDRQRMEQALQEQIDNMDTSARLTVLKANLLKLDALQALPGSLRQLRDERARAIADQVARLEQQAEELLHELSKLSTAQALSAWRTRLLKNLALYDEAPLQITLNAALSRADQLASFFEELKRSQDFRLLNPQDVHEVEAQLVEMDVRYEGLLSEAQQTLIEKARIDLQSRANQLRRDALDKLARLEKRLGEGEAPRKLTAEVEQVPAFLPEDALTRWQALKASLEMTARNRELDQAISEQIDAMDPGARIVVLHRYRETLEALRPLSSETTQLRAQHLETILAKIRQLEEDADRLVAGVDSLTDLPALDKWRRRVLGALYLYDETPLREQLEQALARGESLRTYLNALERLAGKQWNTPAEVAAAEQELSQLEADHHAKISEPQQVLLKNVRNRVETYATRQQERARAYLADVVAKERSGASPAQLKAHLTTPPAFLTEVDLAAWESLVSRIQERLDYDIIAQIEEKFRQIATPRQREECMSRLEKLLRETASAPMENAGQEAEHA